MKKKSKKSLLDKERAEMKAIDGDDQTSFEEIADDRQDFKEEVSGRE